MSLKNQPVPFLHVCPVQFEVGCRPSTGMMIPTVGQEHLPDIHKQRRHWNRLFHVFSGFSSSTWLIVIGQPRMTDVGQRVGFASNILSESMAF
jgi:hypothetical protein